MNVHRLKRQVGDTLIEVLFAMSIFALVTVGGLSIMNKGVASAQRALEITQVRNEIDAQAESLRYMNASYLANYSTSLSSPAAAVEWDKISNSGAPMYHVSASGFTAPAASTVCTGPAFASGKYIIIDTKNNKVKLLDSASYKLPETYSQVRFIGNSFEKADGIWVQAVKSTDAPATGSGYIDFYIQACWYSIGQSIPVTLGTVVRLYEPR